MKIYWMAVGIVVLIVALVGVGKSFSTPSEVTVNAPVKVLDYQQQGQFDYQVTARPAFFYGSDVITSIPVISPQIPIKFIQSIVFSYTYQSNSTNSGSIAINAILENPGAWKKTVNLIPAQAWSKVASSSFSLDLKSLQTLGDAIQKEIGGLVASTYNVTLQAIVSSGTGPDFVQLLPIKINQTFMKIDDTLTSTNSAGQGKFDYQVKLADNTLFGPVTLTPPVTPPTPPDTVLGPTDTIFTKFIDSIKINYNYKLTASQPLKQITTDVIVEAILENPDKWTKTYTIVPPTQQTDTASVSFPLDLTQFTTIFDTIQQETGIAASTENMTIRATLHSVAQTNQGLIDKTFTQSIATNLRNGIFTWTGDLKKSEPGSIQRTQAVTEQGKILRLPVLWFGIISVLIALLMLILLGMSVASYIFPERRKKIEAQTQAKQLNQKYKELIVEVREWPEVKSDQTILTVDSLPELIKVAQGLLKPVNHASESGSHIYWVNDDSTRYEFRLGEEPPTDKGPRGGQRERFQY
jgi:hypothetical protein